MKRSVKKSSVRQRTDYSSKKARRITGRYIMDRGVIVKNVLGRSSPYWASKKGGLRNRAAEKNMVAYPTLLIVDDEPVVRNSVVRTATVAGFRKEDVACASDGDEALKILEKKNFSVIVLDWRMCRVGGDKVIEALLKMGRRDLVKKIFVHTGTPDDLRDCPLSGQIGGRVLVKETDPRPLQHLLSSVVKRKDVSNWYPPTQQDQV